MFIPKNERPQKKVYEKCIFLSCGHGGWDPIEKKYTTENAKFFEHNVPEFHNESKFFYEGIKNREYGDLIAKLLEQEGVNVIKVYHPYKDTSLKDRINLANEYHANIQKGIYISEHSNASLSHTARGFCVFTSPGTTKSDEYATELIKDYKNKFLYSANMELNHIKVREDNSDGDPDLEARFSELVHTKMPAVLIENLFFDNYLDAKTLMNPEYKYSYCKLVAKWILNILD